MGAPDPLQAPERAIRSIHDALAWGDEWVSAYAELLRDFRRLEAEYAQLVWQLETSDFLHKHTYPLAMEALQKRIAELPPEAPF